MRIAYGFSTWNILLNWRAHFNSFINVRIRLLLVRWFNHCHTAFLNHKFGVGGSAWNVKFGFVNFNWGWIIIRNVWWLSCKSLRVLNIRIGFLLLNYICQFEIYWPNLFFWVTICNIRKSRRRILLIFKIILSFNIFIVTFFNSEIKVSIRRLHSILLYFLRWWKTTKEIKIRGCLLTLDWNDCRYRKAKIKPFLLLLNKIVLILSFLNSCEVLWCSRKILNWSWVLLIIQQFLLYTFFLIFNIHLKSKLINFFFFFDNFITILLYSLFFFLIFLHFWRTCLLSFNFLIKLTHHFEPSSTSTVQWLFQASHFISPGFISLLLYLHLNSPFLFVEHG